MPPAPTDDHTLRHLQVDAREPNSLGLVELALAFEEEFEIDIHDEDTEHIRTVGDAVRYIEEATGTARKTGSELSAPGLRQTELGDRTNRALD